MDSGHCALGNRPRIYRSSKCGPCGNRRGMVSEGDALVKVCRWLLILRGKGNTSARRLLLWSVASPKSRPRLLASLVSVAWGQPRVASAADSVPSARGSAARFNFVPPGSGARAWAPEGTSKLGKGQRKSHINTSWIPGGGKDRAREGGE